MDYNDNLIVSKITNHNNPITIGVDLWVIDHPQAESFCGISNHMKYISKSFDTSDLPWSSKVIVALKVLEKSEYKFVLEKGESVTIAVSVYTNHDTENYFDSAVNKVSSITEKQISKQFVTHNRWWENFWNSSSVTIEGEALIEKLWYVSHYIMACCSKNPNFPPGLFGNWITSNFAEWSGDYHLNYNHEAPWWGLYSSNMIEVAKPYEAPIIDYVPMGKKAAEKIGCNGIYYVVGLGPLGTKISSLLSDDGEELGFWGQKLNASWSGVNMIMRYYYTYDSDYARNIAYPYLKEVADFWETYLRFEDGRYVIYNDCSHEVAYWVEEIRVNGSEYANDFNPLLSLALIRLIFDALIKMSNDLGMDKNRYDKWNHILNHISEFPTQKRQGRTVFKDCERGKDWPVDDNTLGIPNIFPISQISLGSDKELLQIAWRNGFGSRATCHFFCDRAFGYGIRFN